VKVAFDMQSFRHMVRNRTGQIQMLILLRHFLWKSQSLFVQDNLRGGDTFLMAEPDAELQNRLQQFDGYAAEIEAKARAESVPLVAVLLPSRFQGAMISMGEWPAGYDPYKGSDELRAIIVSHGGTYIDILPYFRTIPNPEQYYFPVDGHPDAGGHAIISRLIAKELTSGSIPALRAAAQPQVIQESGR
jgi:hypothetical protein